MKIPVISLVEWQKRFGTEKACANELAKVRWPHGFQCPACGSQKYSIIGTRKLYQCSEFRHQVSVKSRYFVSCYKDTTGKMVLGDLPDGF